jgi:hypothetical protein
MKGDRFNANNITVLVSLKRTNGYKYPDLNPMILSNVETRAIAREIPQAAVKPRTIRE